MLWDATVSLPPLQSCCGTPQCLCHRYNHAVGRHSVFATVTIMLWDATVSLPPLQSCCGTPQCLCHRYNHAVGRRRRLCFRDNRSKPLGFVYLHAYTNTKTVISNPVQSLISSTGDVEDEFIRTTQAAAPEH